jgi:hypothetical protein
MMAKKIARVKKRAWRVEKPFFSNQWRSMPKITARNIEKIKGPNNGAAAFIPASIRIAAAMVIRIRDRSDIGMAGFMMACSQ